MIILIVLGYLFIKRGWLMKKSNKMLFVLMLVLFGLSMTIPDRNGIVTFFEPMTEARVLPIQAMTHFGEWATDKMSCRITTGHNLHDRVEVNGKTYSQKSPGIMWVGLPIYKIATLINGGRVIPFNTTNTILGIFCSLIPILLVCYFFGIWLTREFGIKEGMIAIATFLCCGPMYVYGTMFTDAGLPAMLTLAMFLLIQRNTRKTVFFAGFVFAFACITNYSYAIAGCAIAGVEVIRRIVCKEKMSEYMVFLSLGVVIPVSAFLIYNAILWGNPFVQSYDFLSGNALKMHSSMHFSWAVLLEGLVGDRRGLFYHAPWTVFGVVGLISMFFNPRRRWIGFTGILVCVGTLAFQSYYVSSNLDMLVFSRHAFAMYPWLIIGVMEIVATLVYWKTSASVQDFSKVFVHSAIVGSAMFSFVLAFVVGWTYPYHSDGVQNHLWNVQILNFTQGNHLPLVSFAPMFDRFSVMGNESTDRSEWLGILLSLAFVATAFAIPLFSNFQQKEIGERSKAKSSFVLRTVFAVTIFIGICFASSVGFVSADETTEVKRIIAKGMGDSSSVSRLEMRRALETRDALRAGSLAEMDIAYSRFGGGPASYVGFNPKGFSQNPRCGFKNAREEKMEVNGMALSPISYEILTVANLKR